MDKPTHEELRESSWEDNGFKAVLRTTDDSWRHGVRVHQVFCRKADMTYWAVDYRLSTDGECDELAEGECKIEQAWAHDEVVTVTTYTTVKP